MCRQRLQTTMPGDIYLLLIDGDGNASEATGIWGHVVGIAYPYQPTLQPRYFDPNRGFYYLSDPGRIGADVVSTIEQVYQQTFGLNVKGYLLYSCA